MNTNSRIKNSSLNFITNVIIQGVTILTAFILRRVFISTLGIEFLGISGLFNNILAVLSLAEMGVGTAMSYSLYKEIANKDTEKITQLINFYRVIYNRIAILILIIGLSMLPFLSFIVNLDRNVPHLYIYYFLEVLSSVITYLFVYKTTIVNADQSSYKLNLLGVGLQLLTCLLQIIALLLFKKYMIYLVIGIFVTFINNLIRSKYAEKLYPFIKDKSKILPDDEKKTIWANIKSMFAYKFSGIILNNTDNIIISVIINTTTVGLYSNYLMLNNKLHSVVAMFFSSINASIGNINATESNERKKYFFNIICFLSFWLYSFGTIGYLYCGEDIIKAVTGTNAFVLDKSILYACIILFYLNVLNQPILVYRETTGIFKKGKYSIIFSAFLNIVLSIILGKIFGLFGILIATSISRILGNIWYEPFILYRNVFKISPKEYYLKQILYLFITVIAIIIIYPILNYIVLDHLYLRIMFKFVVCTIVTNLLYFVCFRKSEEYIYIKSKILGITGKILNKKIGE